MRRLRLILLGFAILAAAGGLYAWWSYRAIHPQTDDAYLRANIVTIAPQIGGQVTDVVARENAFVREGDMLFRIDESALLAARDAAQAALDLAIQDVGATGAGVSTAEANLVGARAAFADAQAEFERQRRLFEEGDVSQAVLDQATAQADQAHAAVAAASAELTAAQDQSGAQGAENASIRAAQANLVQADIALSHAVVTAPADGWIANITLRAGQTVIEGQPLFSLVESGHWWVDANFKETDIARIRPGQPASVAIDMYPDIVITGRVESLGYGSGAAFSLLPPENATGNWIKVTQRFPLRIALDELPDDPAFQLRVGASATVTVDASGRRSLR